MSQSKIRDFYSGLDSVDADAMVQHYHVDIRFEDPAFGVLKGNRAGNMWRMLCESQRGKEFKARCSDVRMEGGVGRARVEAWYTFTATGRKVHNIIDSEFHFKDGKIIRHTDRFNLHRWSRQALGPMGLLIGWTPFFRKKLQAQTNRMLDRFEEKLES